ncbi:MAG: hypothetical protein AAF296_03000 [Pseudomonadota bacterium]
MKRFFFAALAALGTLAASPALTQERPLLIEVIVDNAGTLLNADQSKNALIALLGNISDPYRQRRQYQNAIIHIVTTHNPRSVWRDTPRRLYQSIPELVETLAPVTTGCGDLVEAFERVANNIKRTPAAETKIVVFASLFHTGYPCDGQVLKIPQPLPSDLKTEGLTPEGISEIRFYWADRRQQLTWRKGLEDNGLLARLNEAGAQFSIDGMDTTISALRRLGGRR